MSRPDLSILIPFRRRELHARTLFPLLCDLNIYKQGRLEIITIEVGHDRPISLDFENMGINYFFEKDHGVFHKTKILNSLISKARGRFIVPYDIDLVPHPKTLELQLDLALQTEGLLWSGYRLMSNLTHSPDFNSLLYGGLSIAPENKPSALYKYLTKSEAFGVCPFFLKEKIDEIGGWDESFIGWGAEDQDIISRYIKYTGAIICLSTELVYIHLSHPPDENWSEAKFVQNNRQIFYEKHKLEQPP